MAPEPRPSKALPDPLDAEVAELIDWWARAAKMRVGVNAVLQPHAVTFSQWRVIHAAELLVRETGDSVSQLDIRSRVHMDATTASRLMYKLAESGWLDWAPDCYDFAYRIFATAKAEEMLKATRPRVVALARHVRGGS